MTRRIVIVVCALVGCVPAQIKSPAISISENGVGPVNSKTPFNLEEVARLLPGLKVSAGTDATEGQEFPTIEVSDGHGILFRIMPENDQTRIHSVVTKRQDFYRGRGRIGSPYSNLFGMKVADGCFWGKEELSDDLICQLPGSKSIFLLFSGHFYPSSPAIPDLGRMRVTQVFWSAVAAR